MIAPANPPASTTSSQKFIDARSAAKRVGYTADYVTRLAREGKISALQSGGRQWLIDVDSLKLFTLHVEAQKRARAEQIRQQRKAELYTSEDDTHASMKHTSQLAILQTAVLSLCFLLFVSLSWVALEEKISGEDFVIGFSQFASDISTALLLPIESQMASLSGAIASSDETIVDVSTSEQSESMSVFSGVVVVEADTTEKEIQEIKNSFSDPVSVEFDGETSGLITPQFKERSGEQYRFILTPITPSNNSAGS